MDSAAPAPGRPARLAYRQARSYQILRTAHLERAHDFGPASILYAGRRYDFDLDLTAGLDLHQAGPLALVRTLLTNPVDALEVNEPLQRSGLPRAALAVAAVRFRGRRDGRRTRIAAYAIENRDPFEERPPRLRSRLRRAGDLVLARAVAGQLDRVAYGTTGARDLYQRRLGRSLRRAEAKVFSAIPAPCDCPPEPVDDNLVLYLGALHRRKGILELLTAWPQVRIERPGARLLVVGKGELSPAVIEVATEAPDIDVLIDPPRPEIHRLLRRSRALVLFSQRSSSWREQVGLPIVEGLAHGCQIVASSETGLAGWLADHGHTVLDPTVPAGVLGHHVALALQAGPSRSAVLDQLPGKDGRRAADDWLLQPASPDAGFVRARTRPRSRLRHLVPGVR